MRGMAAGEMDASAGACDSYAVGTGVKRLAPLSELSVAWCRQTKRELGGQPLVQRRFPEH